ncbi:hypothetical protein GPECTOR_55g269 [Gonium pectorale]|uniref:Uncharacterized protein n=1 Tax=Gonium pectorale TaxID=33097 RepID=A0A150G6G5_GONPE|nr:hypothetical protein GPECTOR_55g269 [Gonium pectorale]|eukprot:KXZ45363.1 hypothetical protein GPECTOR_55g269 [Gonium pectorale]
MSCRPMRTSLMLLEFLSLGTLSLTVTLGLYFAVGDPLLDTAGVVVGALILVINVALIACFVGLVAIGSLPTLRGTVWPWLADRVRKAGNACCLCGGAPEVGKEPQLTLPPQDGT